MRTRNGVATNVEAQDNHGESATTAGNSTRANSRTRTTHPGTNSRRENSGGTRVMSATVPVTSSAIVPPRVIDIAHPELVKWKRERRAYVDAINARCAATGEDRTKALITVKDSFDRQLLEAMCRREWNTPVDAITEEKIIHELDKIIGNVMNDAIVDIDSIFETELSMDLRERDVKARVIKYFMRCDEIILQHGLLNTFSTLAGVKEKCKILRANLRPAALRDAIDAHHRLVDPSSKTDEDALYRLVKEKALEQEKVFQLLVKRKVGQTRSKDNVDEQKCEHGKRERAYSQQRRLVRDPHGERRQNYEGVASSSETKSRSVSKTPRTGCFHCGKDHWLSACPDLDEEAKEKLLAERTSKKTKCINKRFRAKRIGGPTGNDFSARSTVVLNDVLELPYCADSGSDMNIISREHIDKLRECDATVTLIELAEPVESRTVGGGTLTSTHAADIRLTLNTAAGPVRCQDAKRCLIIESPENEFLVGNELLTDLGINVDRQLEYLASCEADDFDSFGDPVCIPPREQVADELVTNAVDSLIQDAVGRGMLDESTTERLTSILYQFKGWRLELSDDPPASVPPLKIRLKSDATPYRCKVRQYSPEKSEFLETFNKQLVELGWVYENRASRWCCPALPVRKPNSNEFRQTNDYRPVNAMTDPIAGVMPSLQVALERCRGKKYYAMFDFLKGFWQLPLDAESQEYLSYMTDKGVFTPTRVPQGCTDAALHFQATVELVLGADLLRSVVVWIDDLLLFANTVPDLLITIEMVLQKLDKHGFVLSPRKTAILLTEVRWCGRIINEHGIGHDPKRIEALRRIPIPCTAAELQQFLCASNWMRGGLVDYSRVARPLQERLDQALVGTRKSKRAAAGIRIELTADECASFDAVKDLLAHSAMLSYPDPAKQLCLLTDASDRGWGLVVTQVADWKPDIPIQHQPHELLICMGGSFTGSALNWSVIEKESYPIVHACENLEYLLLRQQGFKIYCDHRNIVYLFAPGRELKKHVRGKLLRWSTKLLEYKYTIEHIDGIHNVWTDLISRWGGTAPPVTRMSSTKRFTRNTRKRTRSSATSRTTTPGHIAPLPPRPLDMDGFVWPTLAEIGSVQTRHTPPSGATMDGDSTWRVDGLIWIPSGELELLQRIMVIAHCGANGHRGIHVMENHLRRLFYIIGLHRIVHDFCLKCLLCLHVKGGLIIPRPFSETHHTYERNATLHWDFLTLGDSFGTSKYVLVMKDEATHYVELVACDGPTAEVAAAAILNWYSRFGIPSLWVSDCGSHFKNTVITELNRRLKGNQEFILAYTPWKNGSVERVNRDILQILKALALEFKVNIQDWPYLLPLVQSSINHSPVPSLANKAPIELFTGLPCPTPLDTVVLPGGKGRVASMPPHRPNIETQLKNLRTHITELHKAAKGERDRHAQRYRARPHHERPVNFSVGDYVLRSRVDEKLHANKLRIMWVGPYRVITSAEYYFTIEHLVTGHTMDVHPSRLKFYSDSTLNVDAVMIDHIASQGTLIAVEAIMGHRMNSNMRAYEIKVKWKGFEAIEDSWEPLRTTSNDIPQLLMEYANITDDTCFRSAVTAAIDRKYHGLMNHPERRDTSISCQR